LPAKQQQKIHPSRTDALQPTQSTSNRTAALHSKHIVPANKTAQEQTNSPAATEYAPNQRLPQMKQAIYTKETQDQQVNRIEQSRTKGKPFQSNRNKSSESKVEEGAESSELCSDWKSTAGPWTSFATPNKGWQLLCFE
jgi:hypothetical protein